MSSEKQYKKKNIRLVLRIQEHVEMLSQVILCPYLLFFRTVSGLHLHLQGNGLTNTLPLGQAVLVWEERADM